MRRDIKLISPDYLNFIRKQICLVTHHHIGKSEPHHLKARGWGEGKRNDFTALPLCRAAHSEIEQIGVQKFQAKYELDLYQEMAWLLMAYMIENNLGKAQGNG